jgi:hypothetical protein
MTRGTTVGSGSSPHQAKGAHMYEKRLICLANSRKPPSGRCVAGKELVGGRAGTWIRPVSSRPGHEVSEEERRYEPGTKAQLLDIVSVPLDHPSPYGHQVENHVLDAEYYWTKVGVATWAQVEAAVDGHDPAFWSHSQSTYHGTNDKVAAADTPRIGSSLKLVMVTDLRIRVRKEDGYEGNPSRRRVRAAFTVDGEFYVLSVTDPDFEEEYLTRGDGDYDIGQTALCVSLAEVWNGFAFRVVASVLTPERCEALNAA